MKQPTDAEIMNNPEVKNAITDVIGGVPPIDLDESYGGYMDPMMDGYTVDKLMNDLILAEYLDANNFGEVCRGGIYLSSAMSQHQSWRIAKIIKHGPNVPDSLKVGVIIRFPSNKGIDTKADGKNLVFLNADRIFCTLKPV